MADSFAPIAVVGRACVLPGALSPDVLWDHVVAGRDLLTPCPPGRWRATPAKVMGVEGWNNPAGYVTGFEDVFDPHGFALDAAEVQAFDPLVQWVLHTGREALSQAARPASARVGAVLGNLSLPSEGLVRHAERYWLGVADDGPQYRFGRFMSGLPAHLLARALELDAGAFALDAACASSLYAIKLACDRLHDGTADIMLAGAVNRADQLFLHIGFAALQALSPTGQSRPFHRDANGLVPSEGAATVVLKRLDDALAAGDRIFGVIRGVGLSNDGRARGLLVPSSEGQVRAIRAAYEQSGIAPGDVSLVECHATGTALGDGCELTSLETVFGRGDARIPLGSLKSNLGHTITVAGLAGLLKVLGAMEAGVRPPTLHVKQPLDAFSRSRFRLLTEPEPWLEAHKIAAVSAFGFGGNNAHLLVEQHAADAAASSRGAMEGRAAAPIAVNARSAARAGIEIAVVGLGVVAGECHGRQAVVEALAAGEPVATRIDRIELPLEGLRFPPRDLEVTLGQQLAVLEAAHEALTGYGATPPRERTAVIVGMGCDPNIVRHGLRARLPELGLAHAVDRVAAPLTSAAVVGALPNVVANRLNAQFDLAGPSFAVSSEERSGSAALELAVRALRAGELDVAIVAAVDLASDPVHAAAVREARPDHDGRTGDAAVVLVLERADDARAREHRVLGTLSDAAPNHTGRAPGEVSATVREVFGDTHAAAELLDAAAALLGTDDPIPRAHHIAGGTLTRAGLPLHAGDAPQIHVEAIGGEHVVLVAAGDDELVQKRARARRHLAGEAAPGEGVYVVRPLEGELASVFTGAGAAYHGMGRSLLLAFPELVHDLEAKFSYVPEATRWMYDPARAATPPAPLEKLFGASILCQTHALFLERFAAYRPHAAIGLSSGETNALFAMGYWPHMDGLYEDFLASGAFTRDVGGEFEVLRDAWGIPDARWETWRVVVPRDELDRALADEPDVHLTLIHARSSGDEAGDYAIGGEARAVARVVERLGHERCRYLNYDVAAHTPALRGYEPTWRALHHRPVTPVPHVRLYSHALGTHYEPTDARVADALVGQALDTVDFPALIEAAWNDGVRIFVEHGPQSTLSHWIRRTLGDREHLAVSLDSATDPTLRPLANALARLVAAGVPLDLETFNARMRDLEPALPQGRRLRFAAHAPPVHLPEPTPETTMKILPPAPWLPPVLATSNDAVSVPVHETAPVPVQETAPVPVQETAPAAAPLHGHQTQNNAPVQVPGTRASAGNHGANPLHALIALQSQAHQQYLATLGAQAQVHQAFLDASNRALQSMFAGGVHADVAPPPAGPALPQQAFSQQALPQHPAPAPAAVEPPAPPVAPAASAPPVAARKFVVPASLTPPARATGASSPAASASADVLPGPKFSRAELEILATGKISSVFGPLFERQDGYERQVRMPEPPLLLADRVTGIDAMPGVLGTGRIWTETDVRADSWYLHEGHIPAGIMIESGQADLLLISWMGIDFLNKSERIYRLLGCELTYHGGLPGAGDTLCYEIHADGHARHGDVRLFFFHYDCRVDGQVRLSVRGGQAGFFTDEELASSMGVLWDAATGEHREDVRLDPPAVPDVPHAFDREAVQAFGDGRAYECFGAGYERLATHTCTPRIAGGRMCLVGEVVELDVRGGPWKRGYMRSVLPISPDDWFFEGHFKNDPCMPGTLMFEGGLQAMAFYLTALGYTLPRDGWRFEPVPDVTYALRCRGQATPESRELVYEIFIEEVIDGPVPTLYADILATIDGRKAFHCRGMGLQLVPDVPLSRMPHLIEHHRDVDDPRAAALPDGFRLDYPSMLACGLGKASDALGPMFAVFDGPRRMARMPAPPYHFMTRVTHLDGTMGEERIGTRAIIEYDVPARGAENKPDHEPVRVPGTRASAHDDWYFSQTGSPVMPFCVLLEAGLQPCGWMSLFVGPLLRSSEELYYRNLDGTGTLLREITPDSGTIETDVTMTNLARSAGMVILSFDVEMRSVDASGAMTPFYTMQTTFGFFPAAALATQAGIPFTPEERAWLDAPDAFHVDLTARPAAYFGGDGDSRPSALRLPEPMLLMIDRITGFWPEGGTAGLGRVRAEKDVDPAEWFFKAHFHQDPVQPGSLGIEAMIQTLQFFMLERGLGARFTNPRFEPLALGEPLTWKYRGQVLLHHTRITTELEITRLEERTHDTIAWANAWLWVDGLRIYAAENLAMRIVDTSPASD